MYNVSYAVYVCEACHFAQLIGLEFQSSYTLE